MRVQTLRLTVGYLLLQHAGTAVAGQNNTFIPHKGVLSVAEQSLYISYSDGAGPYDGTMVSCISYECL